MIAFRLSWLGWWLILGGIALARDVSVQAWIWVFGMMWLVDRLLNDMAHVDRKDPNP